MNEVRWQENGAWRLGTVLPFQLADVSQVLVQLWPGRSVVAVDRAVLERVPMRSEYEAFLLENKCLTRDDVYSRHEQEQE